MENWLFLELSHRDEKQKQQKEESIQGQMPEKSVGQGGEGSRERFQGGGPNTWNEGEINLAGSGLSKVVIIAGGEMMIALIWDCLLLAPQACSRAHMHGWTDTHTHTCANVHKSGWLHMIITMHSQSHPEALTHEAHEHAQLNAFAVSLLTDK